MSNLLRRLRERVETFYYNRVKAYYEYAGNLRRVDGETVRSVFDRRVADASNTMSTLLGALQRGEIGVAQWRDAMATELRRAHSQVFALGRGGWQQVTRDDWAIVTARLREEFGYLRDFAREVAAGNLTPAQIQARMNMYASHIGTSFWDGSTAAHIAAGQTQERRILNPAEHCQSCIGYAAQGWVEINSLPSPGDQSECRANCKCLKEYR